MNWDIYFLNIAKEISKNSKCLSRKIGAVLVKDNAIVSTGYNGPARGVKYCDERDSDFYNSLNDLSHQSHEFSKNICPRKQYGFKSGKGLHMCQAGHAERNALIQACRNGVSTKDTTLYCYCERPCKDCMVEIINAGISELVFLKKNYYYDKYSEILLKESNINYREISLN